MESIYPQDFFAVEHPTAPVINIQFRTKIVENEDIQASDHWESITFNPSSYFESFTLEDQGGAQMLNLNLFDKNYAKLENIIVKSLLAARLSNKLIGDPSYSMDSTEYFEFYVSRSSSANLRIRFGYTQSLEETEYIDEISVLEEGWKNRVNSKKTVGKTPWLYFQISGANFRLQKEGLKIELRAFSITGSFLDKAKMVQKFAKVTGPPKRLLEQIGVLINEAAQKTSNGKETVEFQFLGREPSGGPAIDEETKEEIIEIMLGSEAVVPRVDDQGNFRATRYYKTLKNVIREICSKVKPLIYDKDGNEIQSIPDPSPEANDLNEANEAIYRTASYGYVIIEEEDSVVIQFYYQDPNEQIKNQTFIRTYIWNEEGYSIVKNFNVETKTDFASLNLSVATINPDDGETTLHVATGHSVDLGTDFAENIEDSVENKDDIVDFTVGHLREANEALNSPDFNAMFVTNIRETGDHHVTRGDVTSRSAAALLSRKIVSNINDQVFTGNIELPGDPFYLFGSSLKPFSYLIKIIARRPNYVNDQGDLEQGGVSYVSGLYAIKKITHRISRSGYDTNLEVMKWPRKPGT